MDLSCIYKTHGRTPAKLLILVYCYVSHRGSSDVIIIALLLLTLHLLLRRQFVFAAAVYGLCVHFRVYPIVYAPSLFLYAGDDFSPCHQTSIPSQTTKRSNEAGLGIRTVSVLRRSFTWLTAGQRIPFSMISAAVVIFLGWVFFRLYGYEFLHETYFYHLSRQDARHNFSAYFYSLYLGQALLSPPCLADTSGAPALSCTHLSSSSSLVAEVLHVFMAATGSSFFTFGIQFVFIAVFSAFFYRDLPGCWFLVTLAFVTFNKVCTAQYFVWWIGLLPLVLPFIYSSVPALRAESWTHKLTAVGVLVGVWAASLGHWLYWAFLLEFKAEPVFLQIWISSILFLTANVCVMLLFIKHHLFLDWTPTL